MESEDGGGEPRSEERRLQQLWNAFHLLATVHPTRSPLRKLTGLEGFYQMEWSEEEQKQRIDVY